MRLGIITPGYSRNNQDWAIPVLRHLVHELAARHEVTILTLRHPKERGIFFVDGVKVIALGGGNRRGIGRIPLYLRTLHTLQRAAPFDILHGFWADEPAFLAVLAGKRMRIPVVASVFGGELVDLPDIAYGGARSRINRQLSRYALNNADVVTAGSDFVAELTRRVFPSGKIERWPQGVVASGLLNRTVGSGSSILHVGALTPVKDQTTLLRAFAIISAELPHVHLTIAGQGDLQAQLTQLTTQLGLTEKVTFLGHVAHEAMGEVYRSADLLLLTSRHESQAMVLLEAIAQGCPVIGTRVGLIPELVPPALTAHPQDAPALARAAIHLLTDATARQSLLQAQSDQLTQRLTQPHAVAQICEIYAMLRS
jgi:glycosyltransferase involved in cell wall biosynthesis